MKKAIITAVAAIVLAIGVAKPGMSGDNRIMVVTLKTTGVTCGTCAGKIEKGLKSLDGVAGVKVDIEKGLVYASFDTEKVKPATVAAKVTEIGYRSEVKEVSTLESYPSAPAAAKPGCACCNK